MILEVDIAAAVLYGVLGLVFILWLKFTRSTWSIAVLAANSFDPLLAVATVL